MIIPQISELEIVSVDDRGKPNRERVVIHVKETVELGLFGLFLGLKAKQGLVVPLADNFLWFGEITVFEGEWIFVYTGPGRAVVDTLPNSTLRYFSAHWGRKQTILHNPNIVPVLFRLGEIFIGDDKVEARNQRAMLQQPDDKL